MFRAVIVLGLLLDVTVVGRCVADDPDCPGPECPEYPTERVAVADAPDCPIDIDEDLAEPVAAIERDGRWQQVVYDSETESNCVLPE